MLVPYCKLNMTIITLRLEYAITFITSYSSHYSQMLSFTKVFQSNDTESHLKHLIVSKVVDKLKKEIDGVSSNPHFP